MKNSNFIFLLSFCFLFQISCNNKKEYFESEKRFLEYKIDSLQKVLDSVSNTFPFLFEKALYLEKTETENAILAHQEISNTKNGSFWAVESEKRIKQLESKHKNDKFLRELYWSSDTLELIFLDAKCGEWGGDAETIKIFAIRENYNPVLHGYYIKETFDCGELEKSQGVYSSVKYQSAIKKLTDEDIFLMKEAIVDLVEYRMGNYQTFAHAGIKNIVRFSKKKNQDQIDMEGLLIEDYPSYSWNKFHKLKKSISK